MSETVLTITNTVNSADQLKIGDQFKFSIGEGAKWTAKVQDINDDENKVTCMFDEIYSFINHIISYKQFESFNLSFGNVIDIVDKHLSEIDIEELNSFSAKRVVLRLPAVTDIIGIKEKGYTDKFRYIDPCDDRIRRRASMFNLRFPYILKVVDYKGDLPIINEYGAFRYYDEDAFIQHYDKLGICPVFDLYY